MLDTRRSKRLRKWIALIGLMCGVSMLFLDSTVLPVATPTIQIDLNVSSTGINWVINAYFLAMATLVLACGKLADMYGHRRIFSIGMTIFALASALGGLSITSSWLISARCLQGVGGAMMGPASWAIIIDVFPLKERGRAIGLLIGISSVFLSLGPSVGGFLTEFLSWRWIFWLNLPIATAGIALVLYSVPHNDDLSEEKFDVPGFITFSAALATLTIALMQGRAWGWGSPVIVLLLIMSVLFFFLLYVTDRIAKYPFIDFKLYKNRVYLGGSFIVFMVQFLLMISVFWPIFFQKALHLSPLQAGAATLFSTIPVIFSAPLSGWIQDRFGPRLPILIGFALASFCLGWFAIFLQYDSVINLIPGLFFYGISMALIMTPNSTATLAILPPRKRGLGSGMFYTARYTGGALGIALFGSMIINVRHFNFASRIAENSATANLSPKIFWGLMVNKSDAVAELNALAPNLQSFVRSAFYDSYHFAFVVTHLFALSIAIIALVITHFTYEREKG